MHRPVAELLAGTDSRELQAWQAFLTWRDREQRARAKERAEFGDEVDDVTHW